MSAMKVMKLNQSTVMILHEPFTLEEVFALRYLGIACKCSEPRSGPVSGADLVTVDFSLSCHDDSQVIHCHFIVGCGESKPYRLEPFSFFGLNGDRFGLLALKNLRLDKYKLKLSECKGEYVILTIISAFSRIFWGESMSK